MIREQPEAGGGVSVSPRGTARERAQQAVEFYNSSVLRARVGAGLVGPRPYTDRHQDNPQVYRRICSPQNALYRSNSSLELKNDHVHQETVHPPSLRREYGSHGSIDVIAADRGAGATSESFFAMLQDYRPAVLGVNGTDQRSPGPSEYLRGKVDQSSATAAHQLAIGHESIASNERIPSNTSPKLRLKLQRFWGGTNTGAMNNSVTKAARQLPMDDTISNSNMNSTSVASSSADIEERQRRRAFAHFDCQSLTANLGYAAKLRGLLLARRRNTTTGASAASMINTRSSTPDADSGDEDFGDGQGNDLLESCPYFRNEIGGEEERVVSLARVANPISSGYGRCGSRSTNHCAIHRPPMAYGVAILEYSKGDTHWKHATCPYQKLPRPIETRDQGALYYRQYFYGQEHQNWFGMDDQLGPVAISLRRERVEDISHTSLFQYRLVIRTSELLTLRGAVLEDAIPSSRSSNTNSVKGLGTKEVLEYVAPEILLSCLRLGVQSSQCEEQLLKLDEQGLTNHYKVGIMYCRAGQCSEEDMYNNEESGPAFNEFLDTIGNRVRLKGFEKYKAGLDNKTDSTGLYSVYANYQDCEVMFHVSTLLPFTPNNRQQLLRKRHIGNDIVTIVFQEPGAQPFTPKNIRSQFQHVFIIVRVINPCSDNTHYSVAVSRSKEVPVFGPPIKDGAIFPKGKSFADFLLAKVVNAENAAHRSEKFATMATRTRQEYLKDLANNYTTSTLVDTGQKFSIFSSKKKDRPRPRFNADASQRGAICWQVVLDDSGQSSTVDCFLGISTDTLVLIEECSRQIVFVTPCAAILGWSANTNSLRIYHHQGECVTLHMRDSGDRDEQMEIIGRLRAVSAGCMAQELSLKRNNMGQLGFHVQPDGVVTQVEANGLAWSSGLRQGARLVEICKVAVATLSHDQMVDLLKTSILVTVTVIPPHNDGAARRGCSLTNCKYIAGNYEGDYENLSNNEDNKGHKKGAQMQLASNHRRKYERSFSPPRSSNSSGYGTGSSSKSFTDPRFPMNNESTMISSSSGHSDERWYELLESADQEYNVNLTNSKTPPPLPNRVNFQSSTPKKQEVLQLTNHNMHTKVQNSHSLPLVHGNLSLSTNNNINRYEFESNEFKLGDKVTLKGSINESRPLPRTANIEYLVTRAPKNLTEYTVSEVQNQKTADAHSDTSSQSDRLVGIQSEDESIGSSNVSPRLRRSSKHRGTLTPSCNNSRNQSPRPSAEAKLRTGINNRHANRHSANLNSTLQEDLMKLINPDYIPEDSLTAQKKKESCSMVNISSITDQKKRQNKEADKLPQSLSSHSLKNTSNDIAEVIFTMARPATVISNASSASSPNPNEMKLSKEERLSPRVTNPVRKSSSALNVVHEPLPLPDAKEMDWPSLVDTATRAMLQVREDSEFQHTSAASNEIIQSWSHDDHNNGASGMQSITHSASVPELQNHVSNLESRVARETRQRQTLEDEVRRLKEENRRLQDESQTAAQQLRRFTEWFFQTLDRQ